MQDYVDDVTDPKSKNFIATEDRIATFDMDGTFIGELYPTYFEYNLLEYRVLDDPNYRDIAPDDVKETALEIRAFVREGKPLPDHFDMKHARAAAKAYAGMTLAEQWRENGYHVISMRDDFKTIYGENVKKVDFTFN